MTQQLKFGSTEHDTALEHLKMLSTRRAHLDLAPGPKAWLDKHINRLEVWGDEVMISEKEAKVLERIVSYVQPHGGPSNDNFPPLAK